MIPRLFGRRESGIKVLTAAERDGEDAMSEAIRLEGVSKWFGDIMPSTTSP